MQEVFLDKYIRLLDAPGIVPGPNSEVGTILRNCIHVQKLADPVTPVETILQRCNLEEVKSRVPSGWRSPYFNSWPFTHAHDSFPSILLDFQLLRCLRIPDY